MIRHRLANLWYLLRTWRCRLEGHDWGEIRALNFKGVSVRDCRRKRCRGQMQTQRFRGGGRVERVTG